jgi:hypothetical protein
MPTRGGGLQPGTCHRMPTEADNDKPSHVTTFRSSLLSPCISPDRRSGGLPSCTHHQGPSTCKHASGGDNLGLLQHINPELRITLRLPHGPSFLQSCHGRQAFRHRSSFPDTLWTTGAMVADVAKQSPNGDISAWSLHPSRMLGEWTNRSESRLQIELA